MHLISRLTHIGQPAFFFENNNFLQQEKEVFENRIVA